MKTLIYISTLTFILASCQKEPRMRQGDLLFQIGATSAMSEAISTATIRDSMLTFTHVGIALPDPAGNPARDSVLEATSDGGVRITLLSGFLKRSAQINGHPAVVIMRLRDTAGVAASVARARSLLGLPYDFSYRPDNGKMYCSELVRESYRSPNGTYIFPARPMNFRAPDGTMPAFWTELFEKLGEPIPEGVPGTNPNDMARDEALEEIGRYF